MVNKQLGMKESTTLKSQQPIRSDSLVGAVLNAKFPDSLCDYRKAQCFYIGEFDFCWCFNDFRKMSHGMQAEITLATINPDFKFTKSVIKSMLESFFENEYYNNIRLIALVNPQNEQAIRLVKLCGGFQEGRLRKVYGNEDRILFSLLKEEYYGKYI